MKLKYKESFSKLLSFLFVFYIAFFTSHYIWGSLTIGDILLFFCSIFILFTKRKVKIFKPLIIFFSYVTIQTIILLLRNEPYAQFSPTLNKYMRWIIYILILITIFEYIDIAFFAKIYEWIVMLAIIAIVIQSIQVYAIQCKMTVMVPFSEYCMKNQELLKELQRPCAFFLEPQQYATFVLPLLIFKIENNQFWISIIITISILLSTSTQGILCTALIWGWFIVFSTNINIKNKILLIIGIVLFLILFFNVSLFTAALDKLMSVTVSDDIRIARAFSVYTQMPLEDRILGIGLKNVNEYLNYTRCASEWIMNETSSAKNFLSTMGGNFVEFGFLGGLLYIYMLFIMFKKAGNTGKIMTLLISFSAFSQTLVLNAWFVFYWGIYMMCYDEKKVELIMRSYVMKN